MYKHHYVAYDFKRLLMDKEKAKRDYEDSIEELENIEMNYRYIYATMNNTIRIKRKLIEAKKVIDYTERINP